MRLVIIQNQAWAVGMHWSRMQLQKASRAKLVQKARKLNENYDLMASRQRQYGFGSSDGTPELWAKARSLAAYIQLPATSSIIGLFTLQDAMGETFWWVFARENGRNIGLGDQVFTSQVAAEEEIRTLKELLGDMAPDSITCATFEASLEWLSPFTSVSLAAKLRRKGCLELIDRPRSTPFRTWVALGLCCAVGYGANFWLDYKAEQRAQEEKLLSKSQKEARKNALLADPAKHFTQAWLQKPLADQVAALCVQNMRELPTVANGWMLDTVSCQEGRSLQISWKHEGNADYVALPPQAHLQSPKLAVSRQALSISTRTPRVFQDHSRLLTQEMGTRHLFQLCQMTGTKLRLSFKSPEKRTIDKVEVVAPWAQGTWELSELPGILLEEASLSQLLAELPGLTLENISMKNDEWSFKGHIYAKPK